MLVKDIKSTTFISLGLRPYVSSPLRRCLKLGGTIKIKQYNSYKNNTLTHLSKILKVQH